MDVVRDVLDTRVVDRNGREMGRVDGILGDCQPNQPVRLAAILIGPSALGDRVHPALGRFVRRFETRFGLDKNRPAHRLISLTSTILRRRSECVSQSATPQSMRSRSVYEPGWVGYLARDE
jgi:hypothetical protein